MNFLRNTARGVDWFKLNGKGKIKAIKHKGCYSYMVWDWNHKLVDHSELKN